MPRFNQDTYWRLSGLWLALLGGALACRSETPKAPPPPTPSAYEVPQLKGRTTSANIARANLNAAIEHAERLLKSNPSPGTTGNVVGLRLERVRYYGTFEDFDRVDALTKETTAESPAMQRRLRAKVLARLHRFDEALALLAGVETTNARDAHDVLSSKASIWAATGKAAQARSALLEQGFGTGPPSQRYMLAVVEAALGNFDAADTLYRSVLVETKEPSPYLPAATYFALGVMWSERAGMADRGELLYAAALQRLPDFVVANVHSAEIDVESGRPGLAKQKLASLKTADPEPQGLLSAILKAEGKTKEAEAAEAAAKAGYDALLGKHRAAFADHAAEFFMGPGNDAARALQLALENLEARHSERAYSLAIRAAEAAGKTAQACELLEEAKARTLTGTEISSLTLNCSGK